MNIPAKPPQGDAACINKAGLCFCWNSLHQFPHTVLSQGWKLCFAGCCQHRRAMYTHASKLYDDRGTASGGSLVFKLPIVHFYPHPKNHFFPNNFPWYYQSSKYYIWHSSQSPRNIITDQSKASMLPIKKKKHYQKKVCSGKLVLSGNFISDSSQGLIHSMDTTSFGLRMLPCHLQGSLLVYWVLNRSSSRQDKGWDLN